MADARAMPAGMNGVDAILSFQKMAGRQVGPGPKVGTQLETASLREDYLNQVQRDFLSRSCLAAKTNTPSEVTRTHARVRTDYQSTCAQDGGAHNGPQ